MLKLLTLILCLGGCIKPTVEPPAGQTVYLLPTAQPPPLGEVPRPGFVTLSRLEDTMVLDLQNLGSRQERENTRYLIGCDRANQDLPVDIFEQGINLAMNRLSDERFISNVVPIGSNGCIFRITLDDYTLSYLDWKLIELNTLLHVVPDTNRNQTLQALAQTLKPYIWAVETLMMYEADEVADRGGDIYYTLTGQADLTEDFLAQEGIVLQDAVDDEEVLFAGFSQSGIALRKTRLVQVVKSDSGFCMGTFDTVLGGDDLFTNPFSLELAQAGGILRSNKILKFDAQEWICSLNNGLFGKYRLNNANGNAEVEAPTSIVVNVNNAAVDAAIRIGDCNECHYTQVAIPISDQIAPHLRGNSAFDADEKLLGDVFFRPDRIAAVINDINIRNARTMRDMGITSPVDPLTQVVWKPFRNEMNAAQVAGFTFLTTETFLERLRGTDQSSQVFGNLLNGGTVSLATLSGNYVVLVAELGIFKDNEL